MGWPGLSLVAVAILLLTGRALIAALRPYRPLLLAGSVLALITAVYPRPGNPLGLYLFGGSGSPQRLPTEVFGVAWWLVGAWLVKGLLDLLLRRTLFPDDNEPHARRLFADLASALIYVVAFVGIIDTVLKQPLSAVLATSGVMAIVLGLALQSTLADLFSGLAINIGRPFRAGDWITISGGAEGRVIEINWRATLVKTAANDMTAIPNSVITKATVTNHRHRFDPHYSTVTLKVAATVPPTQVIEALLTAARGSAGLAAGAPPLAYAAGFADARVIYELSLPIDDFTQIAPVVSAVIVRVVDAFIAMGVAIGDPVLEVVVGGAIPAQSPPSSARIPPG
jgi:small-conductance mechanosensitive channel